MPSIKVIAIIVVLAICACAVTVLIFWPETVDAPLPLTPARIAGPSMAPTLLGDHVAATCGDCGFDVKCAAEFLPEDSMAACPNCGYRKVNLRMGAFTAGDRIRVDERAYDSAKPKRDDVIAFRSPLNADEAMVKRIVGLPGEMITIRDGDVYINEKIRRKTIAEFQQVAMVVHDDRHRSRNTATIPRRWFDDANTHWTETKTGYKLTAPTTEPAALTYRQLRCFASPIAHPNESPMLDSNGYNQQLSRQLNDVIDMAVQGSAGVSGEGDFRITINNGRDVWTVRLRPSGNAVSLHRGDKSDAVANATVPLKGNFSFLFGVLDEQVIFSINEKTVFRESFTPGNPSEPTSQPISMIARNVRAAVRELRVVRDIVYVVRGGTVQSSPSLKAGDGYIVLGDNPPASVDSRRWETPVLLKDIIGKAVQNTE